MNAVIPLSLPDELAAEVRSAAKATDLSQQDVIRQSLKAGLPIVRKALAAKAGRLTNVDPLPDKVLERLYRERDDNPPGIKALMAAQPLHPEE